MLLSQCVFMGLLSHYKLHPDEGVNISYVYFNQLITRKVSEVENRMSSASSRVAGIAGGFVVVHNAEFVTAEAMRRMERIKKQKFSLSVEREKVFLFFLVVKLHCSQIQHCTCQ